MKKKILCIIVSIVVLATMLFAITACDFTSDTSSYDNNSEYRDDSSGQGLANLITYSNAYAKIEQALMQYGQYKDGFYKYSFDYGNYYVSASYDVERNDKIEFTYIATVSNTLLYYTLKMPNQDYKPSCYECSLTMMMSKVYGSRYEYYPSTNTFVQTYCDNTSLQNEIKDIAITCNDALMGVISIYTTDEFGWDLFDIL